MIFYIFWNLSTESSEALTGSASGLMRLRRWATSYIIFPQIVRATDRTWYPWIKGEWLHYNTPASTRIFPGFPSSGTDWFMVWCYVREHFKVKPAVVWSKTLRRGGQRLKSHVIDLKTQGSNLAPLGTRRIVDLLHYADIHLYKLMS